MNDTNPNTEQDAIPADTNTDTPVDITNSQRVEQETVTPTPETTTITEAPPIQLSIPAEIVGAVKEIIKEEYPEVSPKSVINENITSESDNEATSIASALNQGLKFVTDHFRNTHTVTKTGDHEIFIVHNSVPPHIYETTGIFGWLRKAEKGTLGLHSRIAGETPKELLHNLVEFMRKTLNII